MKKHEHSGSSRKALEDPRGVLVAAGLRQGMTLLDIGTGSGYLALAAAGIVGPRGKVVALDIYRESIDALRAVVAAKAIGNVEPTVADAAKRMPVPAHSVDVCLMSNVLHGFVANDELARVMAHAADAMKEEGELVIIDFKKMETAFGPPLSIRLSPEEVENLMAGFGFTLRRQFEAGPGHYALVFRQKGRQ